MPFKMFIAKYLLPALVPLKFAAGASSDPCDGSQKPIVISTQSDADALGSCSTITGNLTIDSSAQGDIDIHGVKMITGDLVADGAQKLSSLTAPLLSSIGGTFKLNNLIFLTVLEMDSLGNANSINFTSLPNLAALTCSYGVRNTGSISIVDTGIGSLKPIQVESIGDFIVTGNPNLVDLTLESITNMTGLFNVVAGMNMSINLPNLVTATEMSLNQIGSLVVPSLASVTGPVNITSDFISSISAPGLMTVGSLSIDTNPVLNNLSMPSLKSISGDLYISGNYVLEQITGFPKLSKVQGDLTVVGNYSELALPALSEVDGQTNATSEYDFSCDDAFDTLQSHKGDLGWYNCSPGSKQAPVSSSTGGNSGSNSGTATGTSTPTNTVHGSLSTSSTSASSTSSDAASSAAPAGSPSSSQTKIAIGVSIPLAVMAVGVLTFLYLFWRRHTRKQPNSVQIKDENVPDSPHGPRWGANARRMQELDPQYEHRQSRPPQQAPVQLPVSNMLQELPSENVARPTLKA